MNVNFLYDDIVHASSLKQCLFHTVARERHTYLLLHAQTDFPDSLLVITHGITEVGESNEKRRCRARVFTLTRYALLHIFADKSIHISSHGTTICDPNTCEHKRGKKLLVIKTYLATFSNKDY